MTSGLGSGPGLMLTEHLALGVDDRCPTPVGSQVQEPLPMGDGRVEMAIDKTTAAHAAQSHRSM